LEIETIDPGPGRRIPTLQSVSALGTLEAARAAAAAAALERTLAASSFRTMGGMAAGPLRVPLAILARSAVATRTIALAIGGTLPVIAALLAMGRPLVVTAALAAIDASRLDCGAGRGWACMTMPAVPAASAIAATPVPATLLALGGWQF
jgi:hypothetical protein